MLIGAAILAVYLFLENKRLQTRANRLMHFINFLKNGGRISGQEYTEATGMRAETEARSGNGAFPVPAPSRLVPAPAPVPVPRTYQVSAPAPVPDTSQVPASAPAPALRAKPFSALNIVLIIGVIFIILSGLIFATTTWLYLSNVVRTVIICSLSLVFFGAAAAAEKAFKIRKTAVAFYTLGSLFLPISILAIGYFKLLGSFFSITGDGQYLLFMTASILLGAAAFIGAIKYRHSYFTGSFLLCITLTVLFLVKALYLPYDVFITLMFAYCVPVILASEFFGKKESIKPQFAHIVSSLRIFAVLNTAVIGASGLLTTGTGILSGVSAILLGLLFLKGIFQSKNNYWGVFPYAVFIIVGFMKCNLSGELQNSLMLAAISSIVIILCGLMNVFPANKKKWMSIAGGIWAVCVFFWQFALLFIEEESWTVMRLLAIAILLVNIILVAVLQKSRFFMAAMPFVAVTLIVGFCDYLSLESFPSGLIMTLLAAVSFGIVYFLNTRKLSFSPRTVSSDLVFPVMCLAGGLVDIQNHGFTGETISAHSFSFTIGSLLSFLILIVISVILAFEKKRSIGSYLFAFGLPHFIMMLFLPFQVYYSEQLDIIMLLLYLYGVIAIAAAAGILLENRLERLRRIRVPYTIALILYGTFIPLIEWGDGSSRLYPVYLWILTAYFILYLTVQRRKVQAAAKNAETAMLYFGAGTGLFLAVFASAAALMPSGTAAFYVFLAPAFLAAALCAVYVLLKYLLKIKREKLIYFYRVTLGGLHVLTILTVLYFISDETIAPVFGIAAALLLAVCLFALYIERKAAWAGWISVSLLYAVLFTVFDRLAAAPGTSVYIAGTIGAFAGMAIAGRLLHRKIFARVLLEDGKKKTEIDWFTLLNIIAAAALLSVDGRMGRFLGGILLVIYALLFFRRVGVKYADDITLTFAAAFCCLTYWLQPFFINQGVLSMEINLLPVILFFITLNRFLFQSAKKATGFLLYLASCMCLGILAVDAIDTGELTDAIIIGVIALLMLGVSFMKKSKRWFVLSALTLVILGIYMSRSFWLSLAWWIYLLSAGLALIALAAINEAAKQKGSSLTGKASAAFKDWKL